METLKHYCDFSFKRSAKWFVGQGNHVTIVIINLFLAINKLNFQHRSITRNFIIIKQQLNEC